MIKKGAAVLIMLFLLLAGLSLMIGKKGNRQQEKLQKADFFVVREGPLTIEVSEAGVIKARDQVIIKNEVEGQTSILWIIDEGKEVKNGDLLLELDASKLEADLVDQEIKVQNAEAAYINARENLDVTKNQAESDVDQAELKATFAGQDLKKYLEGEYPQELKEAQSKITVAEEELRRAEEKMEWSRVLFEEKYLSQSELDGDILAARKADLDLDLASTKLDLLKNYAYGRKSAELESEAKQTVMALERAKQKAESDMIQARADLLAKESEYNREKDKLAGLKDQIQKTKVTAPTAGLVIYSTTAKGNWRGNEEPLAAGQAVKERQELIYLPKASSVLAEVKIHESNVEKIKVGMEAKVTVDALPGRMFTGAIASISPLPDPTSMWLNADLKLYTTIIHLEGDDDALKTGMSCRADILVALFEKTLAVPVQAVVLVDDQPTVYLASDAGENNLQKIKPRTVEVGMDNNIMMRIVSGLQVGEHVLLSPPLDRNIY